MIIIILLEKIWVWYFTKNDSKYTILIYYYKYNKTNNGKTKN